MAPTKPKCFICKKAGLNKSIPLVNGMVIHESCYDEITGRVEGSRQRIRQTELSIGQAEQEIQSNNGFLKSLFGGATREFRIAELRAKIVANRGSISSLVDEIRQHEDSLKTLYDFWPEYPPDWEDRRRDAVLKSDQSCAECGSGGMLHVHHIKPIARGGSHLEGNLETLCESCHKKHHPWLGEDRGEKRNKKSSYRQKLGHL